MNRNTVWLYFKELLTDGVITPYVIADSTLFFQTAINILNAIVKKDYDESPDNYQTGLGAGIVLMTGLTLYFTLSQTVAVLFKEQYNSYFSKCKAKLRIALAVPGTIAKTFLGGGSFYLTFLPLVGKNTSLSLAICSSILGIPAQLAFLASKTASTPSEESEQLFPLFEDIELQQNQYKYKKLLKYFVINSSSFCYSLTNTTLYTWSTLLIPEKLDVTDHKLGDGDSLTEKIFYPITFLFALFPLLAIYVSYTDMCENMYGLTKNESSGWRSTKLKIKKFTGIPGAVFKAGNAVVSGYVTFRPYWGKTGNILSTITIAISSLISQSSILFSDPVRGKNSNIKETREKEIEDISLELYTPTEEEETLISDNRNAFLPFYSFSSNRLQIQENQKEKNSFGRSLTCWPL